MKRVLVSSLKPSNMESCEPRLRLSVEESIAEKYDEIERAIRSAILEECEAEPSMEDALKNVPIIAIMDPLETTTEATNTPSQKCMGQPNLKPPSDPPAQEGKTTQCPVKSIPFENSSPIKRPMVTEKKLERNLVNRRLKKLSTVTCNQVNSMFQNSRDSHVMFNATNVKNVNTTTSSVTFKEVPVVTKRPRQRSTKKQLCAPVPKRNLSSKTRKTELHARKIPRRSNKNDSARSTLIREPQLPETNNGMGVDEENILSPPTSKDTADDEHEDDFSQTAALLDISENSLFQIGLGGINEPQEVIFNEGIDRDILRQVTTPISAYDRPVLMKEFIVEGTRSADATTSKKLTIMKLPYTHEYIGVYLQNEKCIKNGDYSVSNSFSLGHSLAYLEKFTSQFIALESQQNMESIKITSQNPDQTMKTLFWKRSQQ